MSIPCDRIERGVLLSAQGHVISSRPGRWLVMSETDSAIAYRVTERTCECADSKKNQTICKHQWATVGFVAAFIILALRKATSIDLAGRILTPAYQMLANLPGGYLRTLEGEYEQAVKRISATTTSDKGDKHATDSPTIRNPEPSLFAAIPDQQTRPTPELTRETSKRSRHASTTSPVQTIQAAGPIYFRKECLHAECKSTRCDRDVRIGGIAI